MHLYQRSDVGAFLKIKRKRFLHRCSSRQTDIEIDHHHRCCPRPQVDCWWKSTIACRLQHRLGILEFAAKFILISINTQNNLCHQNQPKTAQHQRVAHLQLLRNHCWRSIFLSSMIGLPFVYRLIHRSSRSMREKTSRVTASDNSE